MSDSKSAPYWTLERHLDWIDRDAGSCNTADARAELATLRARVGELIALVPFVQHKPNCIQTCLDMDPPYYTCTCGLSAALARIEEA